MVKLTTRRGTSRGLSAATCLLIAAMLQGCGDASTEEGVASEDRSVAANGETDFSVLQNDWIVYENCAAATAEMIALNEVAGRSNNALLRLSAKAIEECRIDVEFRGGSEQEKMFFENCRAQHTEASSLGYMVRDLAQGDPASSDSEIYPENVQSFVELAGLCSASAKELSRSRDGVHPDALASRVDIAVLRDAIN